MACDCMFLWNQLNAFIAREKIFDTITLQLIIRQGSKNQRSNRQTNIIYSYWLCGRLAVPNNKVGWRCWTIHISAMVQYTKCQPEKSAQNVQLSNESVIIWCTLFMTYLSAYILFPPFLCATVQMLSIEFYFNWIDFEFLLNWMYLIVVYAFLIRKAIIYIVRGHSVECEI